MPSWAKFGGDAQKLMEEEKARQAARDAERDKLWRFSLKPGEGATVVFLDGSLETQGEHKGMLVAPFFREHTVKTGPRRWDNFICLTMIGEDCGICDQTGRDGDLCAAFTVVDTTERTGRDNKVYKNQRRLFIAKQQTYQALQAIATELDGIAGLVMKISRTGDRTARVGDVLVPLKKLTIEEIVGHFGEPFGVATDYETELQVVPAAELIKLGVIQATASIGAGQPGAPFGPGSGGTVGSGQPGAPGLGDGIPGGTPVSSDSDDIPF
jgi:hypothetical protein